MLPSVPVVRSGIALARHLPSAWLHAIARLCGHVAWWLAGSRRAVVLENVRHLASGTTPAAQRAMARRLLANMFEAAADLFRLPHLGAHGVLQLATIEGIQYLEQAHAAGRGVLLITGHVGPYELGAACVAAMGYPVHAMVEELDPETNGALAAYRRATGVQLLSRNTGVRQMYRLLKSGAFVALVADRVVGEGSPGVLVPFGDACRAVPEGPGAFATATGAMVIVGRIVRDTHTATRYRMTLDAPIDARGTEAAALTRALAERLDAMAQATPDQWYVFQPEWKPGAGLR